MNENPKKKKILIADDEEKAVKMLRTLCEKLGYESIDAEDGNDAIDKTLKQMPDLILMDITMPQKDGFETTQILKNADQTRHIPIIVLTGRYSRNDILRGISIGADDYLTKPVDLDELSLRIKNHLKIKEYHDFLAQHNEILERQVAKRTKSLQRTLERLDKAHSKIKGSYIETIQRLSLAAEYKDEDTGSHIKRLSFYAKVMAEALGMDSDFTNTIYCAIPMHDIGKVGIPDNILFKPEALTPAEWEIMKTHTTIGARILSQSDSSFLIMAEQIALSHHERWDGRGYPNGLKGENIPFAARITNIVDQYDALRSRRPYKPAYGHDKVFKILTEGDERTMPEHFDPEILHAFKKNEKLFEEVFESNRDFK